MLSIRAARDPAYYEQREFTAEAYYAEDGRAEGRWLGRGAEELGLAGARAWVAEERAEPGVALNVDGVDDVGAATCMYTRRQPVRLLTEIAAAAKRIGVAPPRPRRLVPGILTDGVALADAGWEAVTVSRGTLRTLARIHGPGDSVDRLTGAGIAETARLVAEAAGALASCNEGSGVGGRGSR